MMLRSVILAGGLLTWSTLTPAVSIDHLAVPNVYDNAVPYATGQTFIAQSPLFSGIRVYIGDPSRPGDPSVGALTGIAELVLYEASDLSKPTLVARKDEVLASGVTVQGLVTLAFDAPVPTTIGTRYFIGIQTLDPYGIGLRELLSSTYEEGAQAFQQESRIITEHPNGRDLSFQVLAPASAPAPGTAWLVAVGVLAWKTSSKARTPRRRGRRSSFHQRRG